MAFNFPLFSVPLAFILCYVPHAIRVVVATKAGLYDNVQPRKIQERLDQADPQTRHLIASASGAHNNQLETIGVYAAGIVANSAVGVARDDWQFITLAIAYLALRVAYIAVYLGPPVLGGYLRSAVFAGVQLVIFLIWIKAVIH